MPTIKDVARLTGLSRTTISRVLNDHPYVSDEKREAVLQAVKELGYTLNSSARSLRNNQTKTIAILISRITNPFFSQLSGGDELAAGFVIEAKTYNWKIPDNLAVVGFDDHPVATIIDPQLTTIRQPIGFIGDRAMNTMIAMLKGEVEVKRTMEHLQMELVQRSST
ncbi:DNA-binding LacI/PurR family transcriptional regulator [Geomicrobium halophilum]|uniref:DNA-binding LacI/PurR family transcriptional regulator n=1 Tax=Geomicrobium halophilum TaxID=549000 RepID=A0A841PS72_9BACL|nr:LacI family DNA-binding transcriptional regulator [Geomicrobium halophilum]MBB6450026.1 DNA-binding LacI/PurR family transcriptional regulator [Geomicrobium halophilum]